MIFGDLDIRGLGDLRIWALCFFNNRDTVLLSVKRICRCCSDRHLGQSFTWNSRSSQGPLHESHPCWMSSPALDTGNLLSHPRPLLGKVKTAGQGCDRHGSCAGIPPTSRGVFVKRHILLTKGLLQSHSGEFIIGNVPKTFIIGS